MRDRAQTESRARDLFSVGIVMGGPEGHPRLADAASRLLKARDRTPDPAHDEHGVHVNVIYNVPGDIWPVRFTGIEAGAFSRKRRVQAIQVAVPEVLPNDDVLAFVTNTMHEAPLL